jgi:hypothetical protein
MATKKTTPTKAKKTATHSANGIDPKDWDKWKAEHGKKDLQDGGRHDGAKGGNPERKQDRRKMHSAQAPARVAPEASATVPATPTPAQVAAEVIAAAKAALNVEDDATATERAPDAGAKLTRQEEKKLAKERAAKARTDTLKKNGGKEKLEIYFERGTRRFLMREGERFEDKGDRLTKLALIQHGLSDFPDASGMSEADAFLLDVSKHRKIDYYGPLPGYRAGLHQIGQQSFLVSEQCDNAVFTEETPAKPTPAPPFISAVLQEALGDFDQWMHFCHWLAVGLRSLRRGDFKPGQFCFFVGKANSGKSLVQFIITVILGGRGVNCAAQFGVSGDPNVEKFTTGLLKGEHWYMGDPVASVQKGARLLMAGRMKTFFHEENFVFRGMQKVGFDVPVFRRGTGSVNDDPSDLMVLPDMRSGLGDKINLYRFIDKGEHADGTQKPLDCVQRFVSQQSLPNFDSTDGADRKAIKEAVEREAPMARAWLLSQFRNVPTAMADDRVGLKAWHHPQLIKELGAISPDARALSFIQKVLFGVPKGEAPSGDWRRGAVCEPHLDLNARELEQRLAQSDFSEELRHALSGIGHGHTLGRLAKSHADEVQRLPQVESGPRLWRLFNPFLSKETNKTTE